jgi:hypothetical protein
MIKLYHFLCRKPISDISLNGGDSSLAYDIAYSCPPCERKLPADSQRRHRRKMGLTGNISAWQALRRFLRRQDNEFPYSNNNHGTEG